MIEIKLGDRYAKSIYELALEKGELQKVKADFQLIEAVCNANPDLVNMLRSPLVFSDKKQQILNKIFAGKLTSAITQTFIEIIVRKKREPWLRDIAMRFGDLYDVRNNITRGTLSSATPLSPEMKERIIKQVEKEMKTTFMLEEKIDPSLIGGFLLRIGDYQYDASIASGLRRLQNEFDSNPYIKEI